MITYPILDWNLLFFVPAVLALVIMPLIAFAVRKEFIPKSKAYFKSLLFPLYLFKLADYRPAYIERLIIKMKNKLLYTIAILLILVITGGFYYLQKSNKQEQERIVEQEEQEQEIEQQTQEAFSFSSAKIEAIDKFINNINSDYKEIPYGNRYNYSSNHDKTQTISVGRYDLKINNAKDVEIAEGSYGVLSIYKNERLEKKLDYKWSIFSVDSFKFKRSDYFILLRSMGGCSWGMKKQFIVYKNDDFDLGDGTLHIGRELYFFRAEIERIFEKNGQVYLLVGDGGLIPATFGLPDYFPIFYKIDSESGDIILSNDEFKDYYKQLAGDIDIAIKKAKSASSLEDTSDGYFYDVLAYSLIVKILSGSDINIAKNEFIADGKFFFKDGYSTRYGETAESAADYLIEQVTLLERYREVPDKFL